MVERVQVADLTKDDEHVAGWAAFSGSVGVLIAARASMGVGAALMMPSTLAIITDMFRDAGQRQRAIGFWAGTSGLGFALGPIVGGLLLAHFWWGSVFLINVPIASAGLLCALPLIPDSKNPAAQRPDLAGAVLSMAGLGLVLWSIIDAPVHGWSSALVIGTGIAGLAMLAGFAGWERASSHPMLNLAFFRRPRFSAAVASNGLAMFGLAGSLFVLKCALIERRLGGSRGRLARLCRSDSASLLESAACSVSACRGGDFRPCLRATGMCSVGVRIGRR